jgi:D-amino peptidase
MIGGNMKIYISADIEGITGATHLDETDKAKPDYTEFRQQMTAEVAAACEGALKAGAEEILVKDAHDSARNIIAAQLPPEARLNRGWSGHPYMMMDRLDSSFQAVVMIGYHSRAGSAASPLAHTMTGSNVYTKINGQFASEFTINSYTAALEGVPVVFVSGDAGLCADAAEFLPGITTVAVKEGIGRATTSIHPALAVERIRDGVYAALKQDITCCRLKLPEHFEVEIRYREQARAYAVSFFPGARLLDPSTIHFEADNYFSVLQLFTFVY